MQCSAQHRWVPNMDNPNSRLILSSMEITGRPQVLIYMRNSKFAQFKRFLLGTYDLKQEVPVPRKWSLRDNNWKHMKVCEATFGDFQIQTFVTTTLNLTLFYLQIFGRKFCLQKKKKKKNQPQQRRRFSGRSTGPEQANSTTVFSHMSLVGTKNNNWALGIFTFCDRKLLPPPDPGIDPATAML